MILVYESQGAAVNGRRVTMVYRCHNGKRELEPVPPGRSAIISKMVVTGLPRAIQPSDVVRDYGDLNEWSLIPCHHHTKVREMPKDELMELLGYPSKTSPRFLTLWRVPDEKLVQQLLERLKGVCE
jgi:hypothetical protein